MKELVYYLLETLACSAVLLASYTLLLERKVNLRWCRLYLLLSTVVAAVIPLLRIPVWPGEVLYTAPAPAVGEMTAEIIADNTPAIPFATLILGLYLLGTALILGIMLWQALCIGRLRRRSEITRMGAYRVVRTPEKVASFSFFRSIYIWNQTPAEELPAIILHEQSHIAHHHSVERIAIECLKAALWWNPFVWIAARRLTEAQEYEADSDVLRTGYDTQTYMNTILKQLFGYCPEIANGLRDSLTKKRFQMMTTKTRSRYSLLRLAGTVPAAIGLLCAFGFTSRAAVIMPLETAAAQFETADPLMAPVAEQEKPKKAMAATDIKVQVLFTDPNGASTPVREALVKVAGSDAGTVTDKDGIADLKAVPGSVLEILKLGYKSISIITGEENKYVALLSTDGKMNVTVHPVTKNPLVLVDGLEIEYKDMNSIDPKNIYSVNVLKDAKSTAIYGDRGADGVILITTKGDSLKRAVMRRLRTDSTTLEGKASSITISGVGSTAGTTIRVVGARNENEPFLVTEVMPKFQGGDLSAYRTWVQSNVVYPDEALKKGIMGRVVLSFVVEKDGSLSEITLLQSPDKILSDEAVRVIKASPAGAWTPGKQKGEPVRVKYTLPVDFRGQKVE